MAIRILLSSGEGGIFFIAFSILTNLQVESRDKVLHDPELAIPKLLLMSNKSYDLVIPGVSELLCLAPNNPGH
jgi:hypothetical protein